MINAPVYILSSLSIHIYIYFFRYIYLAMLGFSCSMWDLVPWPGNEPGPLAVRARSLSHWTTREDPFIHSSFDGHLGCFHVLAIANSAAVNPGVHVSLELEFSSFPDICPGVGLLGHMVTLFFTLKKITSTLLSIVAVPIHISNQQHKRVPSSHPLQPFSFFLNIFGIYVYMIWMNYNILVIDFCLLTSCYGENLAVWYNYPLSSSPFQYIVTFY